MIVWNLSTGVAVLHEWESGMNKDKTHIRCFESVWKYLPPVIMQTEVLFLYSHELHHIVITGDF
jgi:hypothetical protein